MNDFSPSLVLPVNESAIIRCGSVVEHFGGGRLRNAAIPYDLAGVDGDSDEGDEKDEMRRHQSNYLNYELIL